MINNENIWLNVNKVDRQRTIVEVPTKTTELIKVIQGRTSDVVT